MAAAEMASLGLPVLHSSGGALPEILEEERWCYGAPQNHEALARKFIELQQYTEYLPDLDLLQERRQRSARIQQTYCAERLASYYWQIIQDHLSTYPQAPAL
jgi:glycosyltransferase involved in cell wall biosynthesis